TDATLTNTIEYSVYSPEACADHTKIRWNIVGDNFRFQPDLIRYSGEHGHLPQAIRLCRPNQILFESHDGTHSIVHQGIQDHFVIVLRLLAETVGASMFVRVCLVSARDKHYSFRTVSFCLPRNHLAKFKVLRQRDLARWRYYNYSRSFSASRHHKP